MAEHTCNGDELEDAQTALDSAVDGSCHHALGRGPQCKQVQRGEGHRHDVSYCREDTQGTPAAFHPFNRLFIHLLACSLNRSLNSSLARSITDSLVRLIRNLVVHSVICSLICYLVHSVA